jgi:hypothetical protein
MRSILRSFILTSAALCASAAFAADSGVVNIPFNFESHGIAFPAGRYAASLDTYKNVLTFRNTQNSKASALWPVSPADSANAKVLRLTFDDLGDVHALHSVQIGSRITPVLDAAARRHNAGSYVAAVSGQ